MFPVEQGSLARDGFALDCPHRQVNLASTGLRVGLKAARENPRRLRGSTAITMSAEEFDFIDRQSVAIFRLVGNPSRASSSTSRTSTICLLKRARSVGFEGLY